MERDLRRNGLNIKNKTIMKKVIINTVQANILEKIAKRSKMDDWFMVREDQDHNLFVYLEDITTLIEGTTPYDLETLDSLDVYYILYFLRTLIK